MAGLTVINILVAFRYGKLINGFLLVAAMHAGKKRACLNLLKKFSELSAPMCEAAKNSLQDEEKLAPEQPY